MIIDAMNKEAAQGCVVSQLDLPLKVIFSILEIVSYFIIFILVSFVTFFESHKLNHYG